MSLADPRPALAEQSSFIGYLVGLAGIARTVRALADATDERAPRRDDDFVYVLLGLASLEEAIRGLVEDVPGRSDSPPPRAASAGWLR